jgi:SAM-dependent methyltransferase
VPRELRHDLGEYYTPDWLAELTLDDAGYDGNLSKRLLDPACGSGTFLVLAIRRARDYADDQLLDRSDTVRRILANVVGFDLNPLAVIAARTNYLLALGTLVRYQTPLELPVYLCDSILTPGEYRGPQATFLPDYPVPSTVGYFHVPRAIVANGELASLTALLEDSVLIGYDADEFLVRARKSLRFLDSLGEPTLKELFIKLHDLAHEGRNGIWARIIKNAFAPVAVGTFDYVVGNPPWVNWESLADDYRHATAKMWQEYGLFSLRGHAARLGGGKKDLAMLMLYAAADHYLRGGGTLAFVITQTLLKTTGAGDGFRRFQLGSGDHMKVIQAQDLSELQPFERATNRTATLVVQKGSATEYPVSYITWKKRYRGRLAGDLDLAVVRERTTQRQLTAQPIDGTRRTSPWFTAPEGALRELSSVIGPSYYRGYAGACTWMNGVFWLRIIAKRPDGMLVVENLHDEGKLKVPSLQAVIEPDLVYPLLRGQDVTRWQARPAAYILVTQDPGTRTGYDEGWMRMQLPNTYTYLKRFEKLLRGRSGYRKYFDATKDPFYSLYDVADYTFTEHKVLWPEVGHTARVAFANAVDDGYLGKKASVPDHTVIMIPTHDQPEAAYITGLLNSSPAQLVITDPSVSP